MTLISYLSSSLNSAKQIRLNTKVTNIDYTQADKPNNSGFITVRSRDSLSGIETIYKCKQLVASVSLNVLKNTVNLFTPPLPASKTASLNRLKFGTNNKIFFVFSQNVFAPTEKKTGLSFLWQNNLPFSLNADTTCNLNVREKKLKLVFIKCIFKNSLKCLKLNQFYKSFAIWRVPPEQPNILFSEFVGDASIFSESLSDACLIQVFTELLKKFYPTKTFPNIVQVIR